MQHRLHIPLSAQLMAARGEVPPELAVVVDLAVKDDHHRAVFVEDGLLAASEVDNAQPPHTQPDTARDMDPLIVGTTGLKRGAHFAYGGGADRPTRIAMGASGDAAHQDPTRN